MHDAPDPLVHSRELPRLAKILLILLVAYAVAVILPDTLRPTALYQLAYYLEGLREAVTGDRPSRSSLGGLGLVSLLAVALPLRGMRHSGRGRNAQIAADLAGEEFVDFSVTRHGGDFPDGRIQVDRVLAAFTEQDANGVDPNDG